MDISGNQFEFRKVFGIGLISASVLLALGLVVFQARFLLVGPRISITEEPTSPQNERYASLSGNAENISRLWLNGRPIYTDMQGNFKEALILENGYTKVTLRAEDRYGRETEIVRTLVYAPTSFVRQ